MGSIRFPKTWANQPGIDRPLSALREINDHDLWGNGVKDKPITQIGTNKIDPTTAAHDCRSCREKSCSHRAARTSDNTKGTMISLVGVGFAGQHGHVKGAEVSS